MPTVPSTPTAADRQREAKEIADKVAELKAIKERAENDTKTSVEAADTAQARATEIENHIRNITKEIPEAARIVKEFLAHCAAVIRESSEKTMLVLSAAKEVAKATDQVLLHLEQVRKDAAALHQASIAETIVLDRQRDDLNIYHKRLVKHFAEHMPGHKIVI